MTAQQTMSELKRWNNISGTIYNTAVDPLGKRERKNSKWFKARIAELEPDFEAKQTALIALRKVWSDAQSTARRCANDQGLKLAENFLAVCRLL